VKANELQREFLDVEQNARFSFAAGNSLVRVRGQSQIGLPIIRIIRFFYCRCARNGGVARGRPWCGEIKDLKPKVSTQRGCHRLWRAGFECASLRRIERYARAGDTKLEPPVAQCGSRADTPQAVLLAMYLKLARYKV